MPEVECWERRALALSCTNEVTEVRISIPRIRDWGSLGERAKRRPPKPQPMSAIVTCLDICGKEEPDESEGFWLGAMKAG